jgi:hypothetical protein
MKKPSQWGWMSFWLLLIVISIAVQWFIPSRPPLIDNSWCSLFDGCGLRFGAAVKEILFRLLVGLLFYGGLGLVYAAGALVYFTNAWWRRKREASERPDPLPWWPGARWEEVVVYERRGFWAEFWQWLFPG